MSFSHAVGRIAYRVAHPFPIAPAAVPMPLMHFVYREGRMEYTVTAQTAQLALLELRMKTGARVAANAFLIDVREIPSA